MTEEFTRFSSIPRLNRDIVITEKIDGTNAQVHILEDGTVLAGSRTKYITPGKQTDNFGFALWVEENKEELRKLGYGRHFGEWWGAGIQRRYGLKEKRFSLFNVSLWGDEAARPKCCGVVPVLYRGPWMVDMGTGERVFAPNNILRLLEHTGSIAAPGFMQPEGIIVFHAASGHLFKATLEGDEGGKGAQK